MNNYQLVAALVAAVVEDVNRISVSVQQKKKQQQQQ